MPDIRITEFNDIVYRQCPCRPTGIPSSILTSGRIEGNGFPTRIMLSETCLDCGRTRMRDIEPKREEEVQDGLEPDVILARSDSGDGSVEDRSEDRGSDL